jgi:hypothetical protein
MAKTSQHAETISVDSLDPCRFVPRQIPNPPRCDVTAGKVRGEPNRVVRVFLAAVRRLRLGIAEEQLAESFSKRALRRRQQIANFAEPFAVQRIRERSYLLRTRAKKLVGFFPAEPKFRTHRHRIAKETLPQLGIGVQPRQGALNDG